MALLKSQATLHCDHQAGLYSLDMTLGNRIKAARERLIPKLTQKQLGDAFNISDKAVSAWERDEAVPEPDKMPKLRKLLKVPYAWLLEGTSAPPAPDDVQVRMEDLSPAERAAVNAMVDSFLRERGKVA